MGIFNKEKTGAQRAKIARTNARAARATLNITGEGPLVETGVLDDHVFDRCPSCRNVVYAEDLEKNNKVCTNCGHHFRLTARERIALLTDSFCEFGADVVGGDPLEFPGYPEKIGEIRKKTGENEGITTGVGEIGGEKAVLCVMDSAFMMGSMGAAVGEKFTRAVEKAIEERLPVIAFTVSGGARMQEGLVSLMQMAKTSAVLARLSDAGLLYVVVITDPTTGGVTASFAMLGDITLAEPGALIGFAGRRVIEQTIGQVLPKGFQSAEFAQEKGFVDAIVKRNDLKDTLRKILAIHRGGERL